MTSLLTDRQGRLWIGTISGLSQYDGKSFVTLPQFAGKLIRTMIEDRKGYLWVGTLNSGVIKCATDGNTFTQITTDDGLPSNRVWTLREDRAGNIWIGTVEGLTKYTPNPAPPSIYIESIVADQVYTDPKEVTLSAGTTHLRVNYKAVSFVTRPEAMQYFYQLEGHEKDWQGPTHERSAEYLNLKPGSYTFKVKAVNRDLVYSEPASVRLKVVPPWYQNEWIVFPSGGVILAFVVSFIIFVARYYHQRRESQRLREQMLEQERQARETVEAKNEQIQALNEQLQDENLRLAAELEITERIQRMILPSADELQSIAGLDLAGYMQPADDVGGDYYDVLQQEGTVAISIGDVTGHGLESGLVMLMTQTAVQALLHSGETDPVRFLNTLNRTIYNNVQRMASDKNLTLCLLDYQSGELKLSGQHEEMIVVRQDGTVELVDTVDLGFPIGLEDEIALFINQTTVQLQPGDGVALYTDGITEAENESQEQYGLERLCKVVSQYWSQSAEAIKEAAIADLRKHIGTQEVYDDITLVVLKQK